MEFELRVSVFRHLVLSTMSQKAEKEGLNGVKKNERILTVSRKKMLTVKKF